MHNGALFWPTLVHEITLKRSWHYQNKAAPKQPKRLAKTYADFSLAIVCSKPK